MPNTITKVILGAAVGAGLVIAPATAATAATASSPARADSTPAGSVAAFGQLTVTSPTTYSRGESFTVSGAGAAPFEIVFLSYRNNLATSVQATREGRWSFTIPASLAEKDSVTLGFEAGRKEAEQTFTASDGQQQGGLAVTSQPTYARGQAFTITGTGADPYRPVDVRYRNNVVLSTLADASGAWSVTVPATAAANASLDFRFESHFQESLEQTFTAR